MEYFRYLSYYNQNTHCLAQYITASESDVRKPVILRIVFNKIQYF